MKRYSPSVTLIVALTALAGAFVYVGSAAAIVTYRFLSDGLIAAAWVASAVGVGALLMRLMRLGPGAAPAAGPVNRLLVFATSAALGLGAIGLATLGLGLSGWLSRRAAVLLLLPGLLWGVYSLAPLRTASSGAAPSPWRWLWLAVAPFLAVALACSMVPPGLLWNPEEPHGYDVVEYHLQVPREWYEAGRIEPLRHNVFSYFPMGVEIHYLLAMHLEGGPWNAMYLAQIMHLMLVALAVLAACGVAHQFAASPRSAALAGVALATTPWLAQLAPLAYNEGGLLLFGTLSAGWAMLAMADPHRRLRRFALAGMLAGLACGTKLTAVPEILLGIPLVCAATYFALSRASGGPGRAVRPVRNEPETFCSTGVSPVVSSEKTQARRLCHELLPKPNADRARTALGGIPAGSALQTDSPTLEKSVGNADPTGMASGGPASRAAPPSSRHGILGGCALFVLAGALAFAPWLVRNAAWSGNPVFPEAAQLLGKAHWNDAQVARWHRANHEPGPDKQGFIGHLRGGWEQVLGSWQFGYLLLPLGCCSLVVAWIAAGRAPPSQVLVPAGLLLLLSAFWLWGTHLQGRFFLFAAPLAAILIAQVEWGRATAWVAVLILLAAGVGWWGLHRRVSVVMWGAAGTPGGAADALGRIPLDWLMPARLDAFPKTAEAQAASPNATISLIGEAKAFFYQYPMSRLHYRTVFDVSATASGDGGSWLIAAWAGRPPGSARPAGEWLVIDGNELQRFSQTYANVPAPPPAWVQPSGEIIVKPGEPLP